MWRSVASFLVASSCFGFLVLQPGCAEEEVLCCGSFSDECPTTVPDDGDPCDLSFVPSSGDPACHYCSASEAKLSPSELSDVAYCRDGKFDVEGGIGSCQAF